MSYNRSRTRMICSNSQDQTNPALLLQARRVKVVEQIITWFKAWLDSQLTLTLCQHQGQESEDTGNLPATFPVEAGQSSQQRPSQKRRSGSDNDDVDRHKGSDEEEERGRGENKGKKKVRVDFLRQNRFACPFYKHDRRFYANWRVCRGPGFDSIHRLKYEELRERHWPRLTAFREHIYRRHAAPKFRCSRCYTDFKNAKK